MLSLTAPQGTETITVGANEDLELLLSDLENGSRIFQLEVVLTGENATATVRGVVKTKAQDEKKWKIQIRLCGKNQTARLELRGVADDASLLTFDGSGIVGVESEEGEISISEKIMLFSERARGHALPVLRVETENVCGASHAATIAPFDEEIFFYLASRGMENETAKELLLEGFLA